MNSKDCISILKTTLYKPKCAPFTLTRRENFCGGNQGTMGRDFSMEVPSVSGHIMTFVMNKKRESIKSFGHAN